MLVLILYLISMVYSRDRIGHVLYDLDNLREPHGIDRFWCGHEGSDSPGLVKGCSLPAPLDGTVACDWLWSCGYINVPCARASQERGRERERTTQRAVAYIQKNDAFFMPLIASHRSLLVTSIEKLNGQMKGTEMSREYEYAIAGREFRHNL